MARLFLDGIYNSSDTPSTITISIPSAKSGAFMQGGNLLRGLIVGDPTWTASNKWGPIINDLANLQDLASLVSLQNQFSWISASTMCWKGTSPLSIAVEFYLINYDSGLNLRKNLGEFVKLAAVGQSSTNSDFKVQVHGGYAPKLLTGNKKFFTNLETRNFLKNSGTQDELYNVTGGNPFAGNTAEGSLSIRFGNKSMIRNLLLAKVSVTESTVEVANQNGSNPQPLYYRVSAQFTGVQPLVTTEVDSMFTPPLG